jgi:tRNA (guanine37-N1)-methyltransferase
MFCIKVIKEKANDTIKSLYKKGIVDTARKIEHDDSSVYIPITRRISGFEYSGKRLKPRENKPKNLEEALLGLGIRSKNVISSFDLMGTIAVVEIPKGIEPRKVARAIMEVHRGVKSVFQKKSGMKGRYRVRELKLIGGKKQKIASYIENGVKLEFDVEKVFFSPRLSNERKRISDLIRKKENVLVLFAGVGPFAICIAKNKPKTKVVGIELNKEAVKWFNRNIRMNKLENVKAVLGDVKKELMKKRYRHWADRIIMPLPKDAEHFLSCAEKACKKGTVIHFYTFVEEAKARKETLEKLKSNLKRGFRIRRLKQVRDYAPKIIQVVADVEVL